MAEDVPSESLVDSIFQFFLLFMLAGTGRGRKKTFFQSHTEENGSSSLAVASSMFMCKYCIHLFIVLTLNPFSLETPKKGNWLTMQTQIIPCSELLLMSTHMFLLRNKKNRGASNEYPQHYVFIEKQENSQQFSLKQNKKQKTQKKTCLILSYGSTNK